MLKAIIWCLLHCFMIEDRLSGPLILKELIAKQAKSVAEFKALKHYSTPFHIVIGNESADLDSVISAMAASWSRGFLPMINISSEELPLRRDIKYVFDYFNIDPDSFLFKEHIPLLLEAAEEQDLEVTLVDHNELARDEKELTPYVTEIIDHHHDEEVAYPRLEEKTIDPVGSTATLIVEDLGELSLDEETAALLAFPILVDTDFLSDPLKTTLKDEMAIDRLKEEADWETVQLIAAILQEKKEEVPADSQEILRKDTKVYQEGALEYAITSLTEQVGWNFNNRNIWLPEVVEYQTSLQVPLWLGLIPAGSGKELIVYASTPQLMNAVMIHFSAEDILREKLRFQIAFSDQGLLFYQIDTLLPRKELQPLLKFAISPFVQSAVQR